MGNRERKEVRAENNDPINFTCGVCKQVHAFEKENPYECDLISEEEVDHGVQD